jgi:hypothetical protein
MIGANRRECCSQPSARLWRNAGADKLQRGIDGEQNRLTELVHLFSLWKEAVL